MVKLFPLLAGFVIFSIAPSTLVFAEDTIELETTIIKGNKELPKILYIVPWKDMKTSKKAARKLELHSLFGDLFDPVLPGQEQYGLENNIQ